MSKTPESVTIEDAGVAEQMAHAGKNYMDVALEARGHGLSIVEGIMLKLANDAGESVRKSHERESMPVLAETFAEAQALPNLLSDGEIDDFLGDNLSVGEKKCYFLKNYLDQVALTDSDKDKVANPDSIAKAYLSTTEVLMRNLRVVEVSNEDPATSGKNHVEVENSKQAFEAKLKQELTTAPVAIREWCEGKPIKYPLNAQNYQGFVVNGIDILDADKSGIPGVRPNFKVQRQISGTFLMAYSDKRVAEKFDGQAKDITKRIYLNPDSEEAPLIYEEILQAANKAGISMQLKIYQRAAEFASKHGKGGSVDTTGGLRGDGIVVYASDESADALLSLVLAVARDHKESFNGRQTSRIPVSVAEGIAVGDEPISAKSVSLTSHRTMLLEKAKELTESKVIAIEKATKTKPDRIKVFKAIYEKLCNSNGIDSSNIAFNSATKRTS